MAEMTLADIATHGFHILSKVAADPVKWMAARCGDARTRFPMAAPGPGTMLITPGGRPDPSSRRRSAAPRLTRVLGYTTTVGSARITT